MRSTDCAFFFIVASGGSMSSSTALNVASQATTENDVLVSLKNITKTYKKGRENVPVLTDMNLDIKLGDFVALMGCRDRVKPPC